MASDDLGLELGPTEFSKATTQPETARSPPVAKQGNSKTVDRCLRAKATPAETCPGSGSGSDSNPTEVLTTRHFHSQHGLGTKAP